MQVNGLLEQGGGPTSSQAGLESEARDAQRQTPRVKGHLTGIHTTTPEFRDGPTLFRLLVFAWFEVKEFGS